MKLTERVVHEYPPGVWFDDAPDLGAPWRNLLDGNILLLLISNSIGTKENLICLIFNLKKKEKIIYVIL